MRKQADKFEKLVQQNQDELTTVEAQLADSDIYQTEHVVQEVRPNEQVIGIFKQE